MRDIGVLGPALYHDVSLTVLCQYCQLNQCNMYCFGYSNVVVALYSTCNVQYTACVNEIWYALLR